MSIQIKELKEFAHAIKYELSAGHELTAYEVYHLATMMVQNRILEEALMTGKEYPGSLEAIAISLGFRPGLDSDLVTNLKSISGDIESFVAENR